MRRVTYVCLLMIAAAAYGSAVHAQVRPAPPWHEARERTYDVLHYRLNLEIDEKKKNCAGTATITLIPLRPQFDLVTLDAAEMNIASVAVGGKQAEFTHPGDTLSVMLDKPYVGQKTFDVLRVLDWLRDIGHKEAVFF